MDDDHLLTSLMIKTPFQKLASSQLLLIYKYIHLKVTYEELTTSSAHSSFSTTYQSSVCFTCSPQVCFGCVTMWLAHSPRPNHLWSATWSPQVGTCLCRYHPSLNLREGSFFWSPQKSIPERGYVLACHAGSPNLGGHLHGRSALRVGRVGKETAMNAILAQLHLSQNESIHWLT